MTKNREEMALLGVWLAATLLLLVGLVTPLMTIETFLILRNSFSVLSGIHDLWSGGKYLLAVVVCAFSVVLPTAKLAFLATYILGRIRHHESSRKVLRLIHDYGRWAMLDVMVVAVLIVTVKLGAVARVEVHGGLYIFGAAVLLIMLLTHRVNKLAGG